MAPGLLYPVRVTATCITVMFALAAVPRSQRWRVAVRCMPIGWNALFCEQFRRRRIISHLPEKGALPGFDDIASMVLILKVLRSIESASGFGAVIALFFVIFRGVRSWALMTENTRKA